MELETGVRVRDVNTGIKGTFLRYERYPGSTAKWATVKWDWAMSARRANPAHLERVIIE